MMGLWWVKYAAAAAVLAACAMYVLILRSEVSELKLQMAQAAVQAEKQQADFLAKSKEVEDARTQGAHQVEVRAQGDANQLRAVIQLMDVADAGLRKQLAAREQQLNDQRLSQSSTPAAEAGNEAAACWNMVSEYSRVATTNAEAAERLRNQVEGLLDWYSTVVEHPQP